MNTTGQILRDQRQKLGLLLKQVAAFASVDQAILSKVERNERRPTKELLEKLSKILSLEKDELMIQYYSDKIATEIAHENCANKVLKVAERKVKYLKSL